MPDPTVHLLTCIRNEGPFLLEFVAHHLVLGFDRIFIAANDCDDGSVRLLRALQAAGHIGFLNHSVPPGKVPQAEGYARLRSRFAVDAADWLMMLDVDEFLNVHTGDNSVKALLAAAPEAADVIALNAMTFGSGGADEWRPGAVTHQFLHRLPAGNKANGALKTLSRNPGHYGAIHNHSLTRYRGPKARLTVMRGDGTLREIDAAAPLWRELRHVPHAEIRHALAQYNHYATKTPDAYRLRQIRGRGAAPMGEANLRHDAAYFADRAEAQVRDTTILRYADRLAATVAAMLADPDIRHWHRHAERVYARRLAALPPAG
ncbi:MAG: glycosyltransferase family 2 protein [Albidovulum sp.]|uniref:glycosyltransferase family 2 protein n=1 Tax=Albidovulum sp. TaxID=1872424 RepID=UPI001322B3D3|nr:glycosyltransferase family 2 protein [Defluviimonas sp.]KAB2881668.1 MAG: glycosyltransferase family 2 protein [Defluviimonas sp.]